MLVEVNCESDSPWRAPNISRELVHDIAMHIAASDPKFVRKEDVTKADFRDREKEYFSGAGRGLGQALRRLPKRWSRARWKSSTKRFACWSSLYQGPDHLDFAAHRRQDRQTG